MARKASRKRAWELAGQLSSSDRDLLGGTHRRTGGAWVSGLVSEFWAQVPNTQGASSPHFLILSGLREAQVVQESQVSSAPSLPRNSGYWRVPTWSPSAPGSRLAGARGVRALTSVPSQRQGKT